MGNRSGSWTIEWKVAIGSAAAMFFLVVIGGLSYRNARRLIQTDYTVAHTQQVLTELASLLAALTEVETSQRAFIITGDEQFLTLYRRSLGPVDEHLLRAKELTADNPDQQHRLALLGPIIEDRLERLATGIRLKEQQGFGPAQEFVRSSVGKKEMDEIRKIIAEMETEERDLLERRVETSRNRSLQVVLTIALLSAAALLFLAGAYVLIRRDLAERRRAELELQKFSIAIQQSPASVVITNVAGDIEYVNPKFTALTGYTAEEVRGKNPRILKSGKTRPETYKQLWDTITSGGEWKGELLNKKKNGELYWEIASISPVRDTQGKITHFLAVKDDITDRKRVNQALEESEKRYRHLVDSSLGLICTHDLEGNLLSVNPAAAGALGYTQAELVGRNLEELLVPGVRPIFPGYLERIRQQQTDSGLMRVATKRGDELAWSYKNVLIKEAGNTPYVLGHAQDVTELRKLQEDLRALSIHDPLTS